jgi:pimeloyl-ACP methyl ester carboxylesterase
VVPVHGAWADSGSWDQVVARLQRQGYPVIAFPTPLRSLPDDSAYLAAFLSSVPGPIVLVGHSYGGAVITNAATQRPGSTLTLVEESGPPAWADIPSWALVGTVDRVILPATQLFMAERAGARIVKVKASHLSMISQPGAVTRLIVAAARSTS